MLWILHDLEDCVWIRGWSCDWHWNLRNGLTIIWIALRIRELPQNWDGEMKRLRLHHVISLQFCGSLDLHGLAASISSNRSSLWYSMPLQIKLQPTILRQWTRVAPGLQDRALGTARWDDCDRIVWLHCKRRATVAKVPCLKPSLTSKPAENNPFLIETSQLVI